MTPKERAAMQQALTALENAYENGFLTGITGLKTIDIITALREALGHSGEANEMVAEPVVKKSLTTDLMVDALTSILEMDVKGHALRERLQFSTLGRKLLDKANKALATVNKSLTAQEQEPVACERCEELAADKGTWYRMAERFAIRNEELKKVLGRALSLVEGEWPEGDETAQPVIDAMKATLANQPAPVRTKDLTDDDIQKLRHKIDWTAEWSYVNFARAVIAKDREKNRG